MERIIGEGGMGCVVAARHLQLGQLVALKFLLPELAQSAEAVARFVREGRSAVQFQSEHVAKVSDVGTLEGGVPFLVMEYLHGSDLGTVIQEQGPMPIGTAISYLLQACEGIAEAHALGIIHRDLKPANLFLTTRRDGSPLIKVLDFGIAKDLASERGGIEVASLTATTTVLGSPLYMSPEQIRSSRNVDRRADIWALGVVLYELLTGAPVYHAETRDALLVRIAVDPPEPLRRRRPDVPAELDLVVLRCLEKDPARRFSSVAELARALRPFAPREARESIRSILRILGAPDPGADVATTGAAARSGEIAGSTGGSWAHTARSARPRLALVAAAALLLFGGALTLGFWTQTREGPANGGPASEHLASSSVPATGAMPSLATPVAGARAIRMEPNSPTVPVSALPLEVSASPQARIIQLHALGPVRSAAPEVPVALDTFATKPVGSNSSSPMAAHTSAPGSPKPSISVQPSDLFKGPR